MREFLNNPISFLVTVTIVVTVLQHVLAYLLRLLGFSGGAAFFSPAC